jgi:Tfp pilus assembly protein PilX
MRTTRSKGATRLRQRVHSTREERGVVMVFVLMATVLIGAITLTVVQLISADVAGGLRELQADQVFNIAQAGVHYAIGKLQIAGANSYAGETKAITSGATTLGTAVITVNCIDTGAAPPCIGAYTGYRRIISTGSLPVSGPSRTVVAVVQAQQSSAPSGICTYNSMSVDSNISLYTDVGSNGTISLGSGVHIYADTGSPPQFGGNAKANSSISCNDGCPTQVQGSTLPNQSATVCASVTLPTFSPGSTDLNVSSAGYTMNTTYSWNNVTVPAGSCSGGTPYTDLKIQAGAAGTTTVVNINTLNMGSCSRLIILGAGKVDLRIASNISQALFVDSHSHFGVLSTDTLSTPAPVSASQLTVWLQSSQSQAAQFHETGIVAGTFIAPNGEVFIDEIESPGNMYASITSSIATFHNTGTFHEDTSGAQYSYTSFNNLRSWKDQ